MMGKKTAKRTRGYLRKRIIVILLLSIAFAPVSVMQAAECAGETETIKRYLDSNNVENDPIVAKLDGGVDAISYGEMDASAREMLSRWTGEIWESNLLSVQSENASASSALASLKSQAGFTAGWSYGNGGCWNFVNAVCQRLYGESAPGGTNGYQLTNPGNYDLVGQVIAPTYDSARNLLIGGYPGDIVQVKGGSAWTSWQHTFILEAADSDGITIYEHGDRSGVRTVRYSWADFYNSYGGFSSSNTSHGISLYRNRRYFQIFNTNRTPVGCIDAVTGGDGTIYVWGWAFDPDDPEASIGVHVYIGGTPGQAGAEGYAIVANLESDDVNAAYSIPGAHRFGATINTGKRGDVSVNIYAIDTAGGTNPGLGSRTVRILEPSSDAVATLNEGRYVFWSKGAAGKAMDVIGCLTDDNANIGLWDYTPGDNQKYDVVRNDDGTYTFIASHSGKAVEVAQAAVEDGANISQYTQNGTPAQRWWAIENVDGTWSFRNRMSGHAIDFVDSNVSQHFYDAENDNQHWYLVPTDVTKWIVTTTDDGMNQPDVVVRAGRINLVEGRDYDVEVDTSSCTVTITATGSFTGILQAHYTPFVRDISNATVTLSPPYMVYNFGTPQRPSAVVTLNGRVLTEGVDYDVQYRDNKNAGIATLAITGKGRCTGTIAVPFEVKPMTLKDAVLTLAKTSCDWTGKAIKPGVTVVLYGDALVEDIDYNVTYTDNTAVGTATVTVTGVGNFCDTVTTTFEIVEEDDPDLSRSGWVTFTDGGRGYARGGRLVTGWLTIGENKYWFGSDGAAATGWRQIDGQTYYFREDGTYRMARGWATVSGKKYLFRSDGRRGEGWVTWDGAKYYADAGVPRTGWQTIDGTRYYFRGTGDWRMASGWATIAGQKTLFRTDGRLADGWVTLDKASYYADAGVPREGWQDITGSGRRYFRPAPDYRMATGWATVDGKKVQFDSLGRRVG